MLTPPQGAGPVEDYTACRFAVGIVATAMAWAAVRRRGCGAGRVSAG